MKRTIRTVLCAALAMVAAVSCQKSAEVEEPIAEKKGTIEIRVNGLMGEYAQQDGVGVKSSLVNTVRVAWENDDVVYVFDGTRYLGKLTAELDKKADGQTDEDRYAKLSGTILEPTVTPCTLSLVHSALITEPEEGAAMSELSIDMSLQSSSKVPFVAYATMEYNNETGIADAIVPFQFATSVIRVNSTGLKANTAISKATLSNVNTACKLTLSGSAAPIVTGADNGTITRTGDTYFAAGKVNAEGEAVFQISVPVLAEATTDARVLKVFQDLIHEDRKFTKNSLNPATSVNTVCQLVVTGALPGEFSVSNDNGATITKIYFSQGNLWYGPATNGADATFNFEANQSTLVWNDNHEIYFFWTTSSTDAVKENYDVTTSNTTDVLFTNATETTPKDGFNINVDGTAQSGWRSLSNNEWLYLFNSTRMKYGKDPYTYNVYFNGSRGLVLYPDDYDQEPISGTVTELPIGVVFLRSTGYYSYTNSNYKYNDILLYWASTSGTKTENASGMMWKSNGPTVLTNVPRNYHICIRLVKDI